MNPTVDQITLNAQHEKQWKSIYKLGAFAVIIVLLGTVLDLIFGMVTGGDLSAIPQTAVGRFEQLHDNCILGLYNLDLLNVINQIIMIPVAFALYAAHRRANVSWSLLAFVIFLTGTIVFITANTALPMFELSRKYALATGEHQQTLYSAAGEALLAQGAHGSLGVFFSFLLPNIGLLIMAFVMLRGKVFGKTNAIIGIIGLSLLIVYIVIVSFVPSARTGATAIAAPGGILVMIWMVLFCIRLFKISTP
jgi:hypothetical protein